MICLCRKIKNMDIRYSVIIPAYNAENTIGRCLNSILQSIRDDFEVLIIDDGSTDSTLSICRKFMEQDQRVKYHRKQNGGVSSARNVGLKYAIGKYVCFVDSDDFVLPEYFDQISSMLSDDKCDLLIFGRKIYDGKIYKSDRHKSCLIADQTKIVTFLSSELRKQKLNFVCDKVFRRDLIAKYNVTFPDELHIGEDKVFVIRYITNIKKIKCSNAIIYVSSIENKDSLSRKIKKDLYESVIVEHDLMNEAVLNSGLPMTLKRQYLSALEFSCYRSAYTVIGEMEKLSLTKNVRKRINKSVCKRYKKYGRKYEKDKRNWFIAMPVRLEWITLISFIMKWKNRINRG